MTQDSTAVVGLDVHKDSVDIAIADGRSARLFGRVGGEAAAVDRAVRKIRSVHRDALFVYEAGPCGFWLYRRLRSQGVRRGVTQHRCNAIALQLNIRPPKRHGDKSPAERLYAA